MSRYIFKLFVVRQSPKTERVIENVRRFFEEELKNEYSLEIIDVLDEPLKAEKEKIFCTPTLLKYPPPSFIKIIGDFEDKERVMKGLDVLY